MLYVGQRVVYVDDRNVGTYGKRGETLPKLNCVYTVREIIACQALYGYDDDGVRLVHIINPPRRYRSPSGPIFHELAFRVRRFRPVRGTNIDVFLTMLEPAPKVLEPA